jgi:molybdenum cofactor synthesis domain-containing protein
MTAAVLIIGNEILSGRTRDLNLPYLGRRFAELGVRLLEARVIPDVDTVIIETVNLLRTKVDVLITTGGIGPTHDDITSECVARAFGVEVVQHADAAQRLLDYYGKEEITDARMKMACVPQGAELIENPVSAAPGYRLENVYVLAGVPPIMQAMFETLTHHFDGGDPIISKTVSCKLAESRLAAGLTVIQAGYPEVNIGSYPFARQGKIGVSIVLQSDMPELIDKARVEVANLIRHMGDEPDFADQI